MLGFENNCIHCSVLEDCCELNGETCLDWVTQETMPCGGSCYEGESEELEND